MKRTLQNCQNFSKRTQRTSSLIHSTFSKLKCLKERNLAFLEAANLKNFQFLNISRFSEGKSQSFAKQFIQSSLKGKKGALDWSLGLVVGLLVALVILAIVLYFLFFSGGDWLRGIDWLLPGFVQVNKTITGIELLRYDILSGKVTYYDGSEWIDFEDSADKDNGRVKLGEKWALYNPAQEEFKAYENKVSSVEGFDYSNPVDFTVWYDKDLKEGAPRPSPLNFCSEQFDKKYLVIDLTKPVNKNEKCIWKSELAEQCKLEGPIWGDMDGKIINLPESEPKLDYKKLNHVSFRYGDKCRSGLVQFAIKKVGYNEEVVFEGPPNSIKGQYGEEYTTGLLNLNLEDGMYKVVVYCPKSATEKGCVGTVKEGDYWAWVRYIKIKN